MRRSPLADSRRTDPEGVSRNLTKPQQRLRNGDKSRAGPQLLRDSSSLPEPSTAHDPAEHRDLDPSVFESLSQRKLVQWTATYLVAAFGILQLTEVLSGIWMWPITLQRGASLILGMGLFPAIVVAWFHGEKGRQDVCALEIAILGTLFACVGIVVWWFSSGLFA